MSIVFMVCRILWINFLQAFLAAFVLKMQYQAIPLPECEQKTSFVDERSLKGAKRKERFYEDF